MPRRRQLFVDVSDAMIVSARGPTGVPRVQRFIARQAAADSDMRIRCVRFDQGQRCYVTIPAPLLATELATWNDDQIPERARPLSILRRAFRVIHLNPNLGKDFDHSYGHRLAKREARARPGVNPQTRDVGGGLRYHFYKNLLRLYRLLHVFLRRVFRYPAEAGDRVRPSDGMVLLSGFVSSRPKLSRWFDTTRERAFVVHDDIPLRHREYLKHASSPGREHFKSLIAGGATILCNSRHTEASLREYVVAEDRDAVRLQVFPMPSVLYGRAIREGLTGRIEPEEPFILYCSTVEVRKNHLLLARIWQEALERGEHLPPLICAGKWSWSVELLAEFMNANPHLAEHVRFVGAVSDLELIALYRSAMFSVFPSFKEGWGMGASESLDFGLPAIVSTAPALTEAVRGLMPAIDPNDQHAWGTEIRRLATDADALEALRRKITENYKPVSEEESWAFIKDRLLGASRGASV